MADTIIHDTLKFTRRLTGAGMAPEQAEAIADAINEHGAKVATKADLRELELRIKLWLLGSQIALGGALLAVMAKGFGWL